MQCNEAELIRARIISCDLEEIDAIIGCVIQRYSELVPESEMVCLFLPKDDSAERKRILEQSVQFLESHQNYVQK